MKTSSTIALALAAVVCLVLVGAGPMHLIDRPAAEVAFQQPTPEEVHIVAGNTVELTNEADPRKLYIADTGSHVVIHRAIGDRTRIPVVRLIAQAGSRVEAHGTNVDVSAQPGSVVSCYEGVILDAQGATVYAYENCKVKVLKDAVLYNRSIADQHAFEGSLTYTWGQGRLFAEAGSTYYAKSPENCDACTQVLAQPGSTGYVYEGAEVFTTRRGGVTVWVLKGGEVACARDCTLYVWEGAEVSHGPNCTVHEMSGDGPEMPDEDKGPREP